MLDDKIKETFPNESVIKRSDNYSVFSGTNLPSFIKDFLIKRYSNPEGRLDKAGVLRFISEHIPSKHNDFRSRLRTNKEEVTVLARIIIETDLKNDKTLFSIPDLEIKSSEGRIPDYVIRQHKELKRDGELWGVVTLAYEPPNGKERGCVQLLNYKPFKPYQISFEYLRKVRARYSIVEWIDLLIRAMEYNPDSFESMSQKLMFISRLLVFVEPRLNMIELAPKGTGKSYVFGQLSKYGWLISGGIVSRAKLFYDMQKKSMGIIRLYDFISMDEIQTIRFSDEDELKAALKTYLEQGYTNIMGVRVESMAGLMLMGNIPLNNRNQPISVKYFTELPDIFKESALLDRFHGFIEGWKLPRITEDLKVNGYTLNVEYFSEILHELRSAPEYAVTVNDLLDVPTKADTRDTTAVKRLTTAYLKVLFPNVRSALEIDKQDFKTFCLEPAMEKRRIIREQISLIDDEFSPSMPSIKIKD